MVEACSNCRFSRPGNPLTVECRRHAPRFVAAGVRLEVPRLPPDFWCGDWEKAPAASRRARTDT